VTVFVLQWSQGLISVWIQLSYCVRASTDLNSVTFDIFIPVISGIFGVIGAVLIYDVI
jgi:hypothetical protein